MKNRCKSAIQLMVALILAGTAIGQEQETSSGGAVTGTVDKKAAAQKIIDAAKSRTRHITVASLDREISDYQIRLDQLNSRLLGYKESLRIFDRDSAYSRSPVPIYLQRAEITRPMDRDAEEAAKIEKHLKVLKDDLEFKVLVRAWVTLTHSERKQVLESECLPLIDQSSLLQMQGVPLNTDIPITTNCIGVSLRHVPGGEFKMGRSGEASIPSERFSKLVRISGTLLISEKEITQSQYMTVTGENPSQHHEAGTVEPLGVGGANDFPVEHVTWYDAVRFCVMLSSLPDEREAGRYYRLPTEAEWEFACRGRRSSIFSYGGLTNRTGFEENLNFQSPTMPSPGHPVAVGRYAPNAYGLHDMHGNVFEWCGDWYDEDYYKDSPATDPPGPEHGTVERFSRIPDAPKSPLPESKVVRGGNFATTELHGAGSFFRRSIDPMRKMWTGFRVVCDINEPSEVALRQYAELKAFDEGIGRELYVKAVKEYHRELVAFKKDNESLVKAHEGKANLTKDENRELESCYRNLMSCHELMAKEYRTVGDSARMKSTYATAALWAEKNLDAIRRQESDFDEQQDYLRIWSIAELYLQAGNKPQAQKFIAQILARRPNDPNGLELQGRLSE